MTGFDFNDSGSGLFGEPVNHEILGPLAVVFDLLTLVEEDQGGESLHTIGSLDAGVLISINFSNSH